MHQCSEITTKGKPCTNKVNEPGMRCNTHKTKKVLKLPELDNYTNAMLEEDLEEHIRHNNYISNRNETLNVKKFRQENFPSGISENIAKFALYKYLGIRPNWNTIAGDLEITFSEKGKMLRIEVKGFSAIAPSSFGPDEKWDWIVFVDCIHYKDFKFKVFLIKYGNTSDTWRNIKMRKESGAFDESTSPELPSNLHDLTAPALKKLCKQRAINDKGDKATLINNLKTMPVGNAIKPVRTYGEIADANKRGDLRHNFYEGIHPQFNEETCKLIFDGHLSELAGDETTPRTINMTEFTDFMNSEQKNEIVYDSSSN